MVILWIKTAILWIKKWSIYGLKPYHIILSCAEAAQGASQVNDEFSFEAEVVEHSDSLPHLSLVPRLCVINRKISGSQI